MRINQTYKCTKAIDQCPKMKEIRPKYTSSHLGLKPLLVFSPTLKTKNPAFEKERDFFIQSTSGTGSPLLFSRGQTASGCLSQYV